MGKVATRGMVLSSDVIVQVCLHLSLRLPVSCSLQVKGLERPPARSGHATCAIREKVFVFGGCSAEGNLLNDLWIFDQDSLTWTCVSTYGAVPCPRRGGSCGLLTYVSPYAAGGPEQPFVTPDQGV